MHACVRIHTYIHTYSYTRYIQAHIPICLLTCLHRRVQTCIRVYMHACMHAYIRTYVHTYTHTYTLKHLLPYVLTYLTYICILTRSYTHECTQTYMYIIHRNYNHVRKLIVETYMCVTILRNACSFHARSPAPFPQGGCNNSSCIHERMQMQLRAAPNTQSPTVWTLHG